MITTSSYNLGNSVDKSIYFKRMNDEIFGPVLGTKSKKINVITEQLSKSKKKSINEKYPLENSSKKKMLKSQKDAIGIEEFLSFSRNFDTNPGNLPSVSKIMQATMPAEQRKVLDEWEKRKIEELGEDGFQKMKRDNFRHGHELHSAVEEYLGHSQSQGDSLKSKMPMKQLKCWYTV